MNQREAKAVNKFIKETEGYFKLFKIENKIPGPMPDVVGENRKGHAFWLEAKQLEKWPARETTFPLKGAFQRGQQGWSRSWNSWGGNAFCLLKVGDGRVSEFYLIDFMRGDLETKTRSELMEVVLAEGINNIISYLENV